MSLSHCKKQNISSEKSTTPWKRISSNHGAWILKVFSSLSFRSALQCSLDRLKILEGILFRKWLMKRFLDLDFTLLKIKWIRWYLKNLKAFTITKLKLWKNWIASCREILIISFLKAIRKLFKRKLISHIKFSWKLWAPLTNKFLKFLTKYFFKGSNFT